MDKLLKREVEPPQKPVATSDYLKFFNAKADPKDLTETYVPAENIKRIDDADKQKKFAGFD
jgi:hypothetical protein